MRNQPRSAASRRATFWKLSGSSGGAFGVTMTSAPEGGEGGAFVGRHLFGHDAHEPVAADGGDERQPDAGVAGGRLDERRARGEFAARARRPRRWPWRCDP